jgi:hypothetical protein
MNSLAVMGQGPYLALRLRFSEQNRIPRISIPEKSSLFCALNGGGKGQLLGVDDTQGLQRYSCLGFQQLTTKVALDANQGSEEDASVLVT